MNDAKGDFGRVVGEWIDRHHIMPVDVIPILLQMALSYSLVEQRIQVAEAMKKN